IELIREDLLRSFWLQGYHKATVLEQDQQENAKLVRKFECNPGVQYKTATLAFEGNASYPSDQLERDLLPYYTGRDSLISEAIHRYRSFREKVEAIYVSRGFFDTHLRPTNLVYDENGTVKRGIQITEGPQCKVSDIDVVGVPQFPDELRQNLRLS